MIMRKYDLPTNEYELQDIMYKIIFTHRRLLSKMEIPNGIPNDDTKNQIHPLRVYLILAKY